MWWWERRIELLPDLYGEPFLTGARVILVCVCYYSGMLLLVRRGKSLGLSLSNEYLIPRDDLSCRNVVLSSICFMDSLSPLYMFPNLSKKVNVYGEKGKSLGLPLSYNEQLWIV